MGVLVCLVLVAVARKPKLVPTFATDGRRGHRRLHPHDVVPDMLGPKTGRVLRPLSSFLRVLSMNIAGIIPASTSPPSSVVVT